MEYRYKTQGTCSREITFEIDEEGKLHNVSYYGGCNGNLQGIGKLVEGRDAREVMNTVRGIRCGFKHTSCPDQLSRAIAEALGENDEK